MDKRYTDNNNGTIMDNKTRLVWTQNANITDTKVTWEAALAYVEQMNERNHLGYSDWYLPRVEELKDLVLPETFVFFTNIARFSYYWSSSLCVKTNKIWVVNMHNGRSYTAIKSCLNCVWPVRNSSRKVAKR